MADVEILTDQDITKIIENINCSNEVTRRALAKRRHDFYRDDGKKFLIEQILREFNEDALAEFRLCPINILKKIVNKRSVVYRNQPKRETMVSSDQALIDYYVKTLCIDLSMMQANRYYNLHSNCVLYCYPGNTTEDGKSALKLCVSPPHLYSIVPSHYDPLKIDTYIFNSFVESAHIAPADDVPSATGVQGFSRESVNVQENRQYVFWTDKEHFTTNNNGEKLFLIPDNTDPDQFTNPIGIKPVINLSKERDAESWSKQGADLFDLCMALQMGWSDILTIAKHQGFSVLTIISPVEPKKISVGVNRGVWLKQPAEGKDPSMQYVQSTAPLNDYKALLMDLLGLTLTTNDMNPGAVSGNDQSQVMQSGFSRLIQMSDALEAIESDKPVLRDAEYKLWKVISAWHNWMFDVGVLNDEAKAMGKFSDKFDVSIQFRDMRPLESDQERVLLVKDLLSLGLVSKLDAIKKLNPDMDDKQAQAKLDEIASERQESVSQFMNQEPPKQSQVK